MTASTDGRELVRQALLDQGLKLGAGVDRRGRPLAWSLDCRELTLDGALLPAIADLLWPALEPYMPALIAGPTVSAAPLVGALLVVAARQGRAAGGALVRRTAKSYGLRKLIEGPPFPRGQRAVIVDDILAHGSSIGRTCRALRDAGATPVAVVTLVDLEVPAAAPVDGLHYTSVFGASELGLITRIEPKSAPPDVVRRELRLSAAPSAPARPQAALTATALLALGGAGEVLVADRSTPLSELTWVAGLPEDAVCLSVQGYEGLTVSRGGLVTAFDLVTRQATWTAQLGLPVHAAAVTRWRDRVVVASTLDCATLELTLLPLDGAGPRTQRTLTTGGTGGTPLDVVVVSDANAIVTTTGAVYSVSPDLAPRWGRRWGVQSNVVPSPTQDVVHLLADHNLLALDTEDGATRWARRILGRKPPHVAASGDGVVVASEITAAAFTSSGSVRWVRSLRSRITAGPTAVGDNAVAVGDRDGTLHLLRAADGTVTSAWALDDCSLTSVVADAELLVLADVTGRLRCLSLPDLQATGER